jgi:hypothetical protein
VGVTTNHGADEKVSMSLQRIHRQRTSCHEAARQELKAEAFRGPRAKKADGERDVLANIAEMPKPYRARAERLQAIIKARAPALSPRTWYGMPAYIKDGNVVCFFQSTRRSASATRRISTKALCGRSPSR